MFKFPSKICVAASAALVALSAAAQTPQPQHVRTADDIKMVTGHNLQLRRQAAQAKTPLKLTPAAAPLKAAPADALRKSAGISTTKPGTVRRAKAPELESTLLFESFEDCNTMLESLPTVLPDGWTSESKGPDADLLYDEDHWIAFPKVYADYYMFAPPADGTVMMGVYYSDDYKDEWLMTPEVAIPSDDYELNFYWYTTPIWMYAIDKLHVDFENYPYKFTNREVLFNVEVLAKADGGEWQRIYDLESQYAKYEYYELAEIDFAEMQNCIVPLKGFGGKNVQFAFRYFGKEGNTYFLDAVSVALPKPEVSYESDLNRLYFGYALTTDGDEKYIENLDTAIEFYPVNAPLTWYNTTPSKSGVTFNWVYYDVDNDGNLVPTVSAENPDKLTVTYRPDYGSDFTRTNNIYYTPELWAKNSIGGVGKYLDPYAQYLQAGGTTEFYYNADDIVKYEALQFDIYNEHLGWHGEGDEALGFLAEPVFGHSVNTDEWWKHHTFGDNWQEGKFSYVQGFGNLYIPHPEASLVVNALNVLAIGTIYDEAEFTASIYSMDEEGNVLSPAVVTKTIKGSDVVQIPYSTQNHLILQFKLDEPFLFSPEGTGYGYLVMIEGYRDENIEMFAPLQSIIPNLNERAFGFYRWINHGNVEDDINYQLGYVAEFFDDYGRECYNCFAIGLDACYPWLEMMDKSPVVEISDKNPAFTLGGYYPAEAYTVEAPDWLNVTLSGRYQTTVKVEPLEVSETDRAADIVIKAPGVSLTAKVNVKGNTGSVGNIAADTAASADLYNLQGILVKKNATESDLNGLPAGVYILGGRKIQVK